MAKQADYQTYTEFAEFTFLGKRCQALDLSRELSPDIPVYPGHMKVAMWTHLTHEESRLRMGDTPFRGYAVKGLALCDHDSTHMDAVYHFNPDRPDLTIDADASRWILDQGVVNVLTDAVSTDSPADTTYPNHTAHAERLVNHTEVVNNIDRIPVHQGFGVMVVPLRLVGATGSPVRIF